VALRCPVYDAPSTAGCFPKSPWRFLPVVLFSFFLFFFFFFFFHFSLPAMNFTQLPAAEPGRG